MTNRIIASTTVDTANATDFVFYRAEYYVKLHKKTLSNRNFVRLVVIPRKMKEKNTAEIPRGLFFFVYDSKKKNPGNHFFIS